MDEKLDPHQNYLKLMDPIFKQRKINLKKNLNQKKNADINLTEPDEKLEK